MTRLRVRPMHLSCPIAVLLADGCVPGPVLEALAVPVQAVEYAAETDRVASTSETAPNDAGLRARDGSPTERPGSSLVAQLGAQCDGGNARACAARDFAASKADCCNGHLGAQRCSKTGRVVCFDGTETDAPACACQ
jgi:hypothetical protein